MPQIGTIEVNLHTVDRDETVYVGPSHTISHKDQYALRRTLPTSAVGVLRTNFRSERSFPVPGSTDGLEKPVTISVACVVPPGIDMSAVETYIDTVLTQAAEQVGTFAVKGDIHLE